MQLDTAPLLAHFFFSRIRSHSEIQRFFQKLLNSLAVDLFPLKETYTLQICAPEQEIGDVPSLEPF